MKIFCSVDCLHYIGLYWSLFRFACASAWCGEWHRRHQGKCICSACIWRLACAQLLPFAAPLALILKSIYKVVKFEFWPWCQSEMYQVWMNCWSHYHAKLPVLLLSNLAMASVFGVVWRSWLADSEMASSCSRWRPSPSVPTSRSSEKLKIKFYIRAIAMVRFEICHCVIACVTCR